ncbi:hypothetical protein GE09DRAFT_192188 [Coniochaeta sp. 2T2.1]|nr:hypothetical protein GE09DRAFT_192188 [Coniochaeta sp. 2T2.1]
MPFITGAILLWGLLSATCASAAGGTIWATPHESYSSSVGVLGCKVDTNRIAYWPQSIDCSNICVSVTCDGRQLYLLRIDQSAGAYDMSYDAWNYLYTGYSATSKPTAGGAIAMEYTDVDASKCAGLIQTKDKKLALSASNSMNFIASCLEQQDSWVAKNYVLYNIQDPLCSYGYDERCNLDFPAQNQAKCPNPLGSPVALTTAPVYNIRYPTGEKVLASNGGQQGAGSTSMAPGNRVRTFLNLWVSLTMPLICWHMLRLYLS